ncbi:MAG: RsmE family RNA methyltransferase [Candidatus Omnitrophica bacterium]|nr:RsmE family RNA methyltransferase [Candidatus Omnitrophota bacterium]
MGRTRIYLPSAHILPEIVLREKSAVHKLKHVLRVRKEEPVFVFDGAGSEYRYTLREYGKSTVRLDTQERTRLQDNAGFSLGLAIPVLSDDKMSLIFQRATELGAMNFHLFCSERSNRKEPKSHKYARWKKIVIEAARQSERLWLPEIHPCAGLCNLPLDEYPYSAVADLRGAPLPAERVREVGAVCYFVGPEGGFSPEEDRRFLSAKISRVSFSPHTLRTETAAITAAALTAWINHPSVR